MISNIWRAFINFWKDYWRLMRKPTPLELDEEYAARTGIMAPDQLDHERDEVAKYLQRS